MKAKLILAACAMALAPSATAHPHPGLEDVPRHTHGSHALSGAFESAWNLSVESIQSEGQSTRARAERRAAASLLAAPPLVELDHREGRGTSTSRESEAALVLPLWQPGQRKARGAAADADAAHAEAALAAARLRIAGEVREAAWQVLAAVGDERAARAHSEALDALALDVYRRVKAGDLARADAMAATAESLLARAAHGETQSRLEAARSRWTLLTGLPAIPEATEPEVALSGAEHPAIAQARNAVIRAQRQLDYVTASSRDPLELSLKVWRETPDVNLPAQNGGGIALRIPFGGPVRNAAREAEAITALDQARAEERRVARRLETELRTARTTVEIARQRLEAEQTRASLLRERAELIDKSFRAGETPLPELLRARDAAAQAHATSTRQSAELGAARARLLQALGVLP